MKSGFVAQFCVTELCRPMRLSTVSVTGCEWAPANLRAQAIHGAAANGHMVVSRVAAHAVAASKGVRAEATVKAAHF